MNTTRGNRKHAEAEPTNGGEFGATNAWSYHNRFYTLARQPVSRNPYSLATTIR